MSLKLPTGFSAVAILAAVLANGGAADLPERTTPVTFSTPKLELTPETANFARAIEKLGGKYVDPAGFANDLDGFRAFLDATGVKDVSAAEMTTPHHPEVAAAHGFRYFLPEQSWWVHGAALALLAQNLRTVAAEHVTFRNWWRPAAYNNDPRVGGAERGDHVQAYGMDLDYASVQGRRRAEQWLRELHRREPWMQLSLGLGPQTTHVGILSPRGHREWHYNGYSR